jgi:peptidoglycan/xylan/chitin deacetylase (PgdA/CDA1 family)
MDTRQILYYSALWLLAIGGVPRIMAKHHSGQGGILSFHRIYDPKPHEFGSHSLSVTPENFRRVVETLAAQGYEFLTMTAVADRLRGREEPQGKFICLTFDDGYADNYTAAYGICRQLAVPMTVYLVSGFVRREFPMWSLGLEEVLATNDVLRLTWEGKELRLDAGSMRKKRQAYFTVASLLVSAHPDKVKRTCADLGARYGIDFMELSDRNSLTPAMIREMHASGLVEFGVHSVRHPRLSGLASHESNWEITEALRDCRSLLGTEIRHFAYPYGDGNSFGAREIAFCREAGFQTAVTTESNTIFASDRERLLTLPRLSYTGTFQTTPLLDLLLSGALPKLRRALRD